MLLNEMLSDESDTAFTDFDYAVAMVLQIELSNISNSAGDFKTQPLDVILSNTTNVSASKFGHVITNAASSFTLILLTVLTLAVMYLPKENWANVQLMTHQVVADGLYLFVFIVIQLGAFFHFAFFLKTITYFGYLLMAAKHVNLFLRFFMAINRFVGINFPVFYKKWFTKYWMFFQMSSWSVVIVATACFYFFTDCAFLYFYYGGFLMADTSKCFIQYVIPWTNFGLGLAIVTINTISYTVLLFRECQQNVSTVHDPAENIAKHAYTLGLKFVLDSICVATETFISFYMYSGVSRPATEIPSEFFVWFLVSFLPMMLLSLDLFAAIFLKNKFRRYVLRQLRRILTCKKNKPFVARQYAQEQTIEMDVIA
uniref:7TM_GPCR_Srx domain-containing protein n=1 Tax=Caenorhabditis tropicalis TaxID=1561998 RepID=A0A1I7T5R8_9PELO